MKQILFGVAALAITLVIPTLGYTQSRVTVGGGADIGQREYFYSCVICHGNAEKGDGPLVEFLKMAPADLTIIQKNNGGVFPFDRLYEVVDGRQAVIAHGPRQMPIWGEQFQLDAAELRGLPLSPQNSESLVRGRIVALIAYLYTLQAK